VNNGVSHTGKSIESRPAEGHGDPSGKQKKKRLTALRKMTLREIHATPHCTAGGAFALRSRYLNGSLHRGSILWQREIAPKENEWAGFLGYSSMEELPISLRSIVKLWIADWLLTSFYTPQANINSNVKEVRAAMNSLARLTRQLHELKKEKPVGDWLKRASEIAKHA
jgi:hypothetical protein